ncbi:hypothetical protein U1Q18_026866 [Sarracenia purpurea var. burkii]
MAKTLKNYTKELGQRKKKNLKSHHHVLRRGHQKLRRMLLRQLASQMPDLRIHSGREPYLRLLPRFRSFSRPHVPILHILLVKLDFLDDVMIHRIETPLERYMS